MVLGLYYMAFRAVHCLVEVVLGSLWDGLAVGGRWLLAQEEEL